MSQPSESFDSRAFASPSKRQRTVQFIGPSYIRMQVISFAISLCNLKMSFINPSDPKSVARGGRAIIDAVAEKAQIRGLNCQARVGADWKRMGGMIPIIPWRFLFCAARRSLEVLECFRYAR
jgi:hypothetical protein